MSQPPDVDNDLRGSPNRNAMAGLGEPPQGMLEPDAGVGLDMRVTTFTEATRRSRLRADDGDTAPPAGTAGPDHLGAAAGRSPRRILVVSADMGEGHNATGRALQAAAERIWPGCSTDWVDTLDAMGPGVGRLFRRIYVSNVEKTPWLYEFFYRSVWQYRWFAASSKRFVGAWSGRRLAPYIARTQPDLILSTYPLGSAGLAWLRRHRTLNTPVGAWVSDFAPHPFWVHRDLDLHFVMHDVAVAVAESSDPGAVVRVSAPSVTDAFRPGDRSAARRRLGLPEDPFIALVSFGSLGFGQSELAVREVLDGDPQACVAVICGRNEALADRIRGCFAADEQVRVFGWVDDMAEFMTAADVVVTNAGGATSLEALACARPLLMYRPIAGHGRANAELMAKAGLAEHCPAAGDVARAVRRLRDDPDRLAAMQRTASAHSAARDLTDGLHLLGGFDQHVVQRADGGALTPQRRRVGAMIASLSWTKRGPRHARAPQPVRPNRANTRLWRPQRPL